MENYIPVVDDFNLEARGQQRCILSTSSLRLLEKIQGRMEKFFYVDTYLNDPSLHKNGQVGIEKRRLIKLDGM